MLAGTSRGVSFTDVARESGLELRNLSGGDTAEKWTILETTGAGACLFDADGDGDLDLYVVNGGTLAGLGTQPAGSGGITASDAFYLNDGKGRFTDATAASGLDDAAWGGGCSAADVDNDGDTDLFVTNFGSDVLYSNEGKGRFTDTTAAAGLSRPAPSAGPRGWSLGAVFFDADGDGDLDLYVSRYLDFDPADREMRSRRCRWKSGEVMCGPRGFVGQSDLFYRNRGDGTFEDVSTAAGVGDALYGMGVVTGDLDGDGDSEIFVANDSQQNLLLVREENGHYRDAAIEAGVALSGDGRSQAGMGADLGDADGDGDEDLLVTNFSDDYHTLYRNDGDLLFTDVSASAGLDPATRSAVGWGGGFFDFDNDGDLDIFFASGHVYPGIESFDSATSFRQRNQLFENDGRGNFREVGAQAGAAFAVAGSARGVAIGDLDDDGDLDLVVINSDDAPLLLRNDGGNALHSLQVKLIGRRSNRDGIGTQLRLEAGGRRQYREARRSGGYLSSSDPRVFFGLGTAERVEKLELRWPSGQRQVLENLPADCELTIDEERGLVGKRCREYPGPAPAGATADTTLAPAAEPKLPPAGPPAPPPQPMAAPPAPPAGPVERQAVLREAQDATRLVLAALYDRAIAAFEALLARLPPWEAARSAADAFGFGTPEAYRAFLASVTDNLGVAYLRAERFEDAAAAARRAIALGPDNAKSHHNLGLALYHARRYPEAIVALRAGAALPKSSPGLRYDLGRALAAAGSCAEAQGELTAALAEMALPDARGRDAESFYYRGGCRSDAGQLEPAVEDLREALARAPGHQKALFKLATALTKAGDKAGAARARELFLARQPADEAAQFLKRSGSRDRAERLRLSEVFLGAGQATQAIQEAQTLIEANAREAAAWTLIGEARLALRPADLAGAAEAFARALAADPALERAKLGAALAAARRRLAEAPAAGEGAELAATVAELRRLLAENPGHPALRAALAESLLAMPPGDTAGAQEALALAESLDKLYGAGDALRLRALLRLGRHEEARRLAAESFFLAAEERASAAG